jgi:hypothetical protein
VGKNLQNWRNHKLSSFEGVYVTFPATPGESFFFFEIFIILNFSISFSANSYADEIVSNKRSTVNNPFLLV